MIPFFGCTTPSVVEIEGNAELFREVLADNAHSSVVVDSFRWAFSGATGVWLADDPETEHTMVSGESLVLVDTAILGNGTTYVGTNQGIRVVDRELFDTPLNDVLSQPILSLNAWKENLWVEQEAETLLVSQGELFSLNVGGSPIVGPVYAAERSDEAWVFQDGFHRIRWNGSFAEVLETAPTPWARRGGRSAGGILWAVQGHTVSRRTLGIWETFTFPERAMEWLTDPESEIIWIRGESQWFVWRGNRVQSVPELPLDERVMGVDSSGRLLVVRDGALERLGVGYSVRIKGLSPNEQLEAETTVTVVPSFAQDVVSIETTVNGAEALENFAERDIEPVALGNGAHEFRAIVSYENGESINVSVPFSVGEFGTPTWKDDIAPIFEEYCALCHNGASESVLNTPESWRERIDAILKYLEDGTMPPQNDATWVPVSPEEVALVRAWRATGMQP